MARPKGQPKLGGRKKGTPNKLTVEAKEAFRLAAEGAGGVEALTAFAIAEPKTFWSLYARLIPLQMTGEGGKDLFPSTIRVELVDPDSTE
jgi:hypothetical protein